MTGKFIKRLLERVDERLRSTSVDSAKAQPGNIFSAPVLPVEQLNIPNGTAKIPYGAMRGRGELISVYVPPSVKAIEGCAFADCAKLESVTLCEGLESVGDNAFNGCGSLGSVVIPDSVRDISGMAFINSGVSSPVLNTSGDTLIYCPAKAAGEEYTVPEGVRRIGSRAFFELTGLKKVNFPETLERIDALAFVGCGITSVTLPKSVKTLGERAFFKCSELGQISFAEGVDPVRAAVLGFRIRGSSFLAPVRCSPPRSDQYWQSRAFRDLAKKCAGGNAAILDRMADYFEEKSETFPSEPFYRGAANLWRYRAYEKGSEAQREWLENYVKTSPGKRLPSACLTEDLYGTFTGETLNALGFLFFSPDREYSLAGLDGDGVVEVSAYESEDGPDGDGFGMETYYDWWYLDGNLCPVPGSDLLHSYSNIDRRISDVKERFKKAHDAVATAAGK